MGLRTYAHMHTQPVVCVCVLQFGVRELSVWEGPRTGCFSSNMKFNGDVDRKSQEKKDLWTALGLSDGSKE